MERYLVKMISGDSFKITEQEYKNLLGKSGLIFIPSTGRTINTISISMIVPERIHELEIDRKDQKEGILHDGTRVIRYFGLWYLDSEIDDKGRPVRLIDHNYYPEVARDCVPTPKEFFEKYEMLTREERLKLIIPNIERIRHPNFVQLKDIPHGLPEKITK